MLSHFWQFTAYPSRFIEKKEIEHLSNVKKNDFVFIWPAFLLFHIILRRNFKKTLRLIFENMVLFKYFLDTFVF
jgi:hypothetical protein